MSGESILNSLAMLLLRDVVAGRRQTLVMRRKVEAHPRAVPVGIDGVRREEIQKVGDVDEHAVWR